MRKHKYELDKIELSENKMSAILVDVFLMEAYITEKIPSSNLDSVNEIKRSFYKNILDKHKVDSLAFYRSFNFYQSHPKEFSVLLNRVDSILLKIKPKDSTVIKPMVNVPDNIEAISSFKKQEKAMAEEFLKNRDSSGRKMNKNKSRIKKNN